MSQTQTGPYPRQSSDEYQEPLGQGGPYPQHKPDERQASLGQSGPYPRYEPDEGQAPLGQGGPYPRYDPHEHQRPTRQGGPYPRDSSHQRQEPIGQSGPYPRHNFDKRQRPIGQSGPYPREPPRSTDDPSGENQIQALRAARRFLILGHLLTTLCRRLKYGIPSGFDSESTYGGALQQPMLSSQERSTVMETSEIILSAMERLNREELLDKHNKRANLAGSAEISASADMDNDRIWNVIFNVLSEDGELEI